MGVRGVQRGLSPCHESLGPWGRREALAKLGSHIPTELSSGHSVIY